MFSGGHVPVPHLEFEDSQETKHHITDLKIYFCFHSQSGLIIQCS